MIVWCCPTATTSQRKAKSHRRAILQRLGLALESRPTAAPGLTFAAVPDDGADPALQIAHDRVGPQAGVKIEMRCDAMATQQVEHHTASGLRLDPELAILGVEIGSTDAHVLVERSWRNGSGVDGDRKSQALVASVQKRDSRAGNVLAIVAARRHLDASV